MVFTGSGALQSHRLLQHDIDGQIPEQDIEAIEKNRMLLLMRGWTEEEKQRSLKGQNVKNVDSHFISYPGTNTFFRLTMSSD
jgi:hypothetical protein